MERREFLRLSGLTAASAALGPRLASLFGGTSAEAAAIRGATGPSLLSLPAAEVPITHVVVLMMENRSFDHYLGWLATDDEFLGNGKARYGDAFYVEGRQVQTFPGPDGKPVDTYYLPGHPGEDNPYRGCNHPDPGHGWDAGRAQRDGGFLAPRSGNDAFALGYYNAVDVPAHAQLARRFTTFDRYHCSLLGPTFPNREYLYGAQSGGNKSNAFPYGADELGFTWETIYDRLNAAGVPVVNYFTDLPPAGLWGPRLLPNVRHIESFFVDCLAGTLPKVSFVDPGFTTGLRTDDHPHGDMRSGQKFIYNAFKAFAESRFWESGVFILTYDEWGGFFDHVPPPVAPDDRHSSNDADNFGQMGFRIPALMASPYARPGFVDHTLYDHTSILRFIEWRFLGAPARGPGGANWWLTSRDRNANNIGASLGTKADPEVDTDELGWLPVSSRPCEGGTLDGVSSVSDRVFDALGIDDPPALPVSYEDKHSFELLLEDGYFERLGLPIDLRPLPYPN